MKASMRAIRGTIVEGHVCTLERSVGNLSAQGLPDSLQTRCGHNTNFRALRFHTLRNRRRMLRTLRSARSSAAAASRFLPPSALLRALSTAEPAAPTHIIRFLDEAGQEQHGTHVEGTVDEGTDASDTHRQLTAITLATLQLDDPVRVNVAKLLPPVPTPPNVFCIGLNYRRHAAEVGMDEPKLPVVFMKASSSVVADGDAIIIPSCASAPGTTDRAFSPSALGSVACSSPSAILSFFLAAASLVSVCEILPLVFLISISTVMRSARFLSLIRH